MTTEPTDGNGQSAEGGTQTEAGNEEKTAGADQQTSGAERPFAHNIHGLVDDILEGVRNFTPVASVRYPRFDFVETSEAYLLVFDLPGVARDDIAVTTEGEEVVLSGERAAPDWGEEATIRRSERPFGGFRRTMRMPADVRIDDIRARLEDGILTVTLPRHTESAGRKVDIEG